MPTFISTDFHTSHRQVDASHQVLLFDLQSHLLGRRRFTHGEQAACVERSELVACCGDNPLDRFGKTAGADGSPVVVPKADAAAHEVIGDLQIVVVRTIEVWEVDDRRIREREVANRIELGEGDHRASRADFSLHRRRRGCRHEKRGERAQKSRGGDVELGLEFVEMLVAALGRGEVHEVPGEERVWQGHVGVNACGREGVAIEVNAFFEIAAFGDAPFPGYGMMTDVGQE